MIKALVISGILLLHWWLFTPNPHQDRAQWFWQPLAAFADRQAETTVHRGAPGPTERGAGFLAGWKTRANQGMAQSAIKANPVPNYAGGSHWLQLSLKFEPAELGRWRHLVSLQQLNADLAGVARSLTSAMELFPNNAYLLLDRVEIFGDLAEPELQAKWAKEAYDAMILLSDQEKRGMGILELRNFHLQYVRSIVRPSREQKRTLTTEERKKIRNIYAHLLLYDTNVPARSPLFQELQ